MENKGLWIVIGTLAVLALAFWLGWYVKGTTIKDEPAVVPAELELQELRNAVVLAESRAENFDSMLAANEELREALKNRPVITRVVPGPIVEVPAPVSEKPREVLTHTGSVERTIDVNGKVFQGEDTLDAATRTKLKAKVKLVETPSGNVFIFETIEVDPFRIMLPVTNRVVESPGGGNTFRLSGIGGWNGYPVLGAIVDIGDYGAGILINKSKPLYLGTHRIMQFTEHLQLHIIGGWNGNAAGGIKANIGWLTVGCIANREDPIKMIGVKIGK